jgi:two-component system nitrogen regulation response regulator GlnG
MSAATDMRDATPALREDAGPAGAARLLIIDDLVDARWVLGNLVRLAGYVPLIAASAEEALEKFRREAPDLVLLDVRMPDTDGFDVLTWVMAQDRSVPVIMLTAYGKIDDAVRAIRLGAFDYVARPFNNEQLLMTVKRALQHHGRRVRPRAVIGNTIPAQSLTDLMGNSTAVQRIVADIEQVGPTNFSVLLTGETGTGKELVARALHATSPRAAKPFVVVDCGAIAQTLLESELFGHEKGSFTNAHQAKIGAFEMAAGGTIFLDEIGNLPLPSQTTLLRVLETHRVHRVGGVLERQLDFRVIAATNVELSAAGSPQNFRTDLYHRLAGFTVRLPALRERREDLPFLVARFLAEANGELCRQVTGLSDAAWQRINRYEWPGNVRELRNCMLRAVLTCEPGASTIGPAGFDGLAEGAAPADPLLGQAGTRPVPRAAAVAERGATRAAEHGAEPAAEHGAAGATEHGVAAAQHHTDGPPRGYRSGDSFLLPAGLLASGRPLADMIGALTADLERAILTHVLDQTHGNKAQAARQLHIDYKTMQTKLRKYGMTHPRETLERIQENRHGWQETI